MKSGFVVKSNRLADARDGLKTHEHKLLALVISKIDTRNKIIGPIAIKFTEYARHCDAQNKNYTHFHKVAISLESKPFFIRSEDRSEFKLRRWFSGVDGNKKEVVFHINNDEEVGCRPYLIDLQERFMKIGLATYFSFRRDYTAGFYELIKSREYHANTKTGKFFTELTIEDIRGKFLFEKKYTEYKSLKRSVIMPSLIEIEAKTNLVFIDLDPIGKPVNAVKIWMSRREKGKDINNTFEQLEAFGYKVDENGIKYVDHSKIQKNK